MTPLESVLQDRAAYLLQDVLTNVNSMVTVNAHDVCVVGGVMDFTKRQPIADLWQATSGVSKYVSGIQ
nr:hypothetical protein [Nesterenkonia jeotgali]